MPRMKRRLYESPPSSESSRDDLASVNPMSNLDEISVRKGQDSGEEIANTALVYCVACTQYKPRIFRYLGSQTPICNACNQHWRRHLHECSVCSKLITLGADPEKRGVALSKTHVPIPRRRRASAQDSPLLSQSIDNREGQGESVEALGGQMPYPCNISVPVTPYPQAGGSSSMLLSSTVVSVAPVANMGNSGLCDSDYYEIFGMLPTFENPTPPSAASESLWKISTGVDAS
eukprot:TRINITY_DN6288_c1_g1_i2.p1 TRINITY_DN6288_c1_g1~~TRINITY_DN6288_c1_g1_i2.p1  ORF type:complete len:232 (+),score=33.68 TRINITY_DN6288_c1_g1_i2:56-751(+)